MTLDLSFLQAKLKPFFMVIFILLCVVDLNFKSSRRFRFPPLLPRVSFISDISNAAIFKIIILKPSEISKLLLNKRLKFFWYQTTIYHCYICENCRVLYITEILFYNICNIVVNNY